MTGICIKFEKHCSKSLCCSLSLVCLIILWFFPPAVTIMHPFAPDVHQIIFALLWATTSLLPLLPFVLWDTIMPYYFMYHLTFSILCSFTLRVGGSESQDYYQVVTSLKGNSSIRDRNLISEEFLSAEILWQSRADPRKTWNYMPRGARILLMAFSQSVSQWNWWHTLGQAFIHSLNETDGILCVYIYIYIYIYIYTLCIYRHNRSKWNSKTSCPHRAYLLVRGDSNKHHT